MFTSFSFPGYFPPTSFIGSRFIEGSTVRTLDVISAVSNCLAAGFAESDIIIDVLLSTPVDLQRVDASDYRSYMMLYRYLQISYYYSAMNGLQRAKFRRGAPRACESCVGSLSSRALNIFYVNDGSIPNSISITTRHLGQFGRDLQVIGLPRRSVSCNKRSLNCLRCLSILDR